MGRLPVGWSRPIKASEADRLFPMAGSVVWNDPPQRRAGVSGLPVVWLMWSPDSAQPQPVLTLWAVPSAVRQVVRGAIHQDVAAAAADWFATVVDVSEVSRSLHHAVQWRWTGDGMLMSTPQFKTRR